MEIKSGIVTNPDFLFCREFDGRPRAACCASGRLIIVYLDIQIGFVLNLNYIFLDVLEADI